MTQAQLARKATGNTFVVGNSSPSIVGFPVISYIANSITVTYSESNMQNATLAENYSFDNGLLVSGNGVDISGFGKVFKLPLNPATLQINTIYSMQIGKDITNSLGKTVIPSTISVNDNDNDGMADDWEKQWFGSSTAKDGAADTDGDGLSDRAEYQYARGNVLWGSNRWALSPGNKDSDGEGISDTYELDNGLNPVSSLDRDLDLDNDKAGRREGGTRDASASRRLDSGAGRAVAGARTRGGLPRRRRGEAPLRREAGHGDHLAPADILVPQREQWHPRGAAGRLPGRDLPHPRAPRRPDGDEHAHQPRAGKPEPLPGDLDAWTTFVVGAGPPASLEVHLRKLIRLTQPADNSEVFRGWEVPCGGGSVHPGLVLFSENHEAKVKVALLLKILEKDPTLSTIQKSGITKKSNELFGEVARQTSKASMKSSSKSSKRSSWFL